jgi:hypothetical protein
LVVGREQRHPLAEPVIMRTCITHRAGHERRDDGGDQDDKLMEFDRPPYYLDSPGERRAAYQIEQILRRPVTGFRGFIFRSWGSSDYGNLIEDELM